MMANIQERRNKDGQLISYSIRVHCGRDAEGKQLKPFTANKGEPTWSEKTARKKTEAYAAIFEEQCKSGLASDARKTFQEYCEYVLKTKEYENEAFGKSRMPRFFHTRFHICFHILFGVDFFALLCYLVVNKKQKI